MRSYWIKLSLRAQSSSLTGTVVLRPRIAGGVGLVAGLSQSRESDSTVVAFLRALSFIILSIITLISPTQSLLAEELQHGLYTSKNHV